MHQENNDLPDPLMFNKVLLENLLKASYASTTLLQMIGNLDEVKSIDSFNYENVKARIRDKIDEQLTKVFSDN